MEPYEERPLSEAREPVMLLFIGIMILLVSFFVIMNHSASIESKRAKAVMRGLVTSFDGGPAPRLTSSLGDISGDAALYGKLGNLVATHFALARVVVIQPGRIFLIELPLGHMWVEDEIVPTDAGKSTIASLAKMLAEKQGGAFYDLDARLVAEPETHHSLARARIAAFGDALEAAGAPKDMIATGVDSGRRDRLRLIFSVHEAADGRD